jgi:hypothetical protein
MYTPGIIFEELMGALTPELTEDEKEYLEEPYIPKRTSIQQFT